METEELALDELLDVIVWGHRIVDIDDKHTYVFRPLTLEERNMANYIYKRSLERSKAPRKKELIKDMIKHKLWRASYQKDADLLREELSKLNDKVDKEKKVNEKRQSASPKLIKLERRQSSIVETLQTIENNYTRYIELPSAEYNAERERGIYCLRCSALSFPEMQPLWGSLQELQEEEDTALVSMLLGRFYNHQIATEAQIRKLARSGLWRMRWLGSRKNRGVKTLFDREMYDLTPDQMHLVYWSQIYDSAFESMDSPSDAVVEDDKRFDEWLDQQNQKRKQERQASELDTKLSKAKDGNEVGVAVDGFYSKECTCGIKEIAESYGPDKRGYIHAPSCPYGVFIYYDKETKDKKIEEVQSANPAHVRKLLANEQKRLAESGEVIEEQKLRGDNARAALGMGTKYKGDGPPDRFKTGRARPN